MQKRWIPVEVNGVLFEQVRPHDHPDVGEGEEHFIVLIECNQRRGMLPFMTPMSSICRGSTCPSRPLAGRPGQGGGVGE